MGKLKKALVGLTAVVAAYSIGYGVNIVKHVHHERKVEEYHTELKGSWGKRDILLQEFALNVRTNNENPDQNRGKKEIPQSSIEDYMTELGFKGVYTNCTSFDEAKLIILGDIHNSVDQNLNLIINRITDKMDIVLVEQPSDRMSPEDFTELEQKDDGGKIDALDGAKRSIRQARLAEKYSADNGSCLEFIARAAKCRVEPIDSPEEDRVELLNSWLYDIMLKYSIVKLKEGKDIDIPLFENIVYDRLGIARRGDHKQKIMGSIIAYLDKHEKDGDEIMYGRQKTIVGNIIKKVNYLDKDQKCVVIVGCGHIDSLKPSLVGCLSAEGIDYIAFEPDMGIALRYRSKSDGTYAAQDTAPYLDNLVPEFLEEQARTGGLRYSGPKSGIITNDVLETASRYVKP